MVWLPGPQNEDFCEEHIHDAW